MRRRLTASSMRRTSIPIRRFDTPAVRTIGLTLYYEAILLAVLVLYSMGEVVPSTFVYQGF